MVTLYKRATPLQKQVLRVVEGAVRNALHAHPNVHAPPSFARSVAKRAAGTLTAQAPVRSALAGSGGQQSPFVVSKTAETRIISAAAPPGDTSRLPAVKPDAGLEHLANGEVYQGLPNADLNTLVSQVITACVRAASAAAVVGAEAPDQNPAWGRIIEALQDTAVQLNNLGESL